MRAAAEPTITLKQLSDCLFAGMGITGETTNGIATLPLGMTPSGGARNPYEAYIYAVNVEGLAPGFYHYSAADHDLKVAEMGKKAGTLVVDRFLYTAMRYPGNYGFIPHTLSEDGDPCDVLIANTRPIIPGAVIAVRPIGVLKMTDEGGGDEKIVAVQIPKLTQRYADVRSYTDLPEISWRQIEHFFAHYKDLEVGKWVTFAGWGDANEAKRLITEAIDRSKSQSTKQG